MWLFSSRRNGRIRHRSSLVLEFLEDRLAPAVTARLKLYEQGEPYVAAEEAGRDE